jgi:hydroxymethylpyrimidine/phosphomethylpyrimidine kinase
MVESSRDERVGTGMTNHLVSIAGYDPSGAAGVLLDIRVFERLGQRGFGVLTAVTAQSPRKVHGVFPLTSRAVAGQFARLAEAVEIAGLKVGMLGTSANLRAVARILETQAPRPRVVDPVLRSSSGAPLLERKAWARFLDAIARRADLITPNLDEAEALTGRTVRSVGAMKSAAEEVYRRSGVACLIKGGHLEGPAVDVLFDGREFAAFSHTRLTREVRGTGCFLSSAVLAYLAQGRPLRESCGLAIVRVGRGIRASVPAAGGAWVFDFSRERGRVPLPAE